MESNNEVKKPSLLSKFLKDEMDAAKKQMTLAMPTAPPSRQAMEIVRNQPGRPSKEVILKQLRARFGLTQAQAKEHLRKVDVKAAYEVDQQLAADKKVDRVHPMREAVFHATNAM